MGVVACSCVVLQLSCWDGLGCIWPARRVDCVVLLCSMSVVPVGRHQPARRDLLCVQGDDPGPHHSHPGSIPQVLRNKQQCGEWPHQQRGSGLQAWQQHVLTPCRVYLMCSIACTFTIAWHVRSRLLLFWLSDVCCKAPQLAGVLLLVAYCPTPVLTRCPWPRAVGAGAADPA